MSHSKRYNSNKEMAEKGKTLTIDEAIETLQKLQKAKFDETVELHAKLNINPEKTEQSVRSGVDLPHGTGKETKIAVFASNPEQIEEAKKAGASILGGEELVEKVKSSGSLDTDVVIASPDMMPQLAKIARILGPRGLMPNPKNETVTNDIPKTVEKFKKGKITFKNDKSGNVHLPIGKLSFENQKLRENFETARSAIEKAKPAGVKGKYLKSMFLTSTMGVSLRIE